jgi:D,D-heptose 1,7-bisphosphate phosphatase
MSLRQAVILCGGKGTRLGDAARYVPKPLVPIHGRPVLDYLIERLVAAGIDDIILAAGHLGQVIEAAYRSHPHRAQIRVIVEQTPLGTAGALRLIERELQESFVVAYGDIFVDFEVAPLLATHASRRALATLLVRTSDHPWDSHLVAHDEGLRITEFIVHRTPGRLYRNVANAAFYAVSRDILRWIPVGQPCDFGENVFPAALAAGQTVQAHYLREDEFVKDMGTPTRLAQVGEYLVERAAAVQARRHRRPVKTLLLDRDGTLNVEAGLLRRPEDLVLLPGVADAMARLKAAELKLIVVTNQPVIARGGATVEALDAIHRRLRVETAGAGGETIDAIYYCPHHPETHFGQGVAELRRACRCRKPAPGLIFQAMREQAIDLAGAVMIGDRATDIRAGIAAGVRTVLVGPAPAREREAAQCSPDASFDSLGDFATALLSGHVFHNDSK